MNPTEWIRPDVLNMEPYTPIFPFDVLAQRLGRRIDEIVKLDANENPYGSSPRTRAALANLDYAHIYPDPESRALRASLARFTGLPTEVLLAGAGVDELIDLIMRLVLQPGDCLLNLPPTFGMYSFDAAIAGARVVSVARRPDFSLDIEAIEDVVERERPKLVFVTSPNNPDGGWLPDDQLRRLLAFPILVALDEAYVEFAGPGASRMDWVLEHDNLIVLRTFSKWAGLAGLRVGYGAFPPALVPYLWKIKQPYNVSVAASAGAIAALEDREHLERTVQRIIDERARLAALLKSVSFLQPYPTRSNFILCRVIGREAHDVKRALEEDGILIRYFDKPGLTDHIRISVGKPEHTDALMASLRRMEHA